MAPSSFPFVVSQAREIGIMVDSITHRRPEPNTLAAASSVIPSTIAIPVPNDYDPEVLLAYKHHSTVRTLPK